VIIQQMVFGNLNDLSGSFVLSTYDPVSGQDGLYVEYAKKAQGDAIVNGEITPKPIAQSGIQEEQLREIDEITKKLQAEFGKYIQVEGVIENGKVWILQCRKVEPQHLNQNLNGREIKQEKSTHLIVSRGQFNQVKGRLIDTAGMENISSSKDPVVLVFKHADKEATELLLKVLDLKVPVAGIVSEIGGTQTHFASVVNRLNTLGHNILYLSNVDIHSLPIGNHVIVDSESGRILVDKGMKSIINDTGGIDLTPANMHLQTQNNNGEIKFHMDPAMLEQLQNAPGFVPVIINIQPLKSLSIFLGIDNQQ